ncbi:sigma-70 family RNA polymerase sigma factor [Rheinheimera sp.]|uniref:sigma-70 family RNA polymerase sigma factor n=1 Tax=Rheinheimera sp. TaxID=1869214 RepID=UPI00307ED4F5
MLQVTTELQKATGCITSRLMSTDSDNQELSQLLTAVALKRDKQAFTALFRFFAPRIKRMAAAKLINSDLANDVVQETMSNIWRKAHLFDPEKGSATVWVYRVMRNVTFDLLRKIKANQEDSISDDFWPLLDEADSSDPAIGDHLAKEAILAGLDCLSEHQRQVVHGVYFMELTQQQLAEQLGVPLGTVKSRLRLALAKLKQQLGEGHD